MAETMELLIPTLKQPKVEDKSYQWNHLKDHWEF